MQEIFLLIRSSFNQQQDFGLKMLSCVVKQVVLIKLNVYLYLHHLIINCTKFVVFNAIICLLHAMLLLLLFRDIFLKLRLNWDPSMGDYRMASFRFLSVEM